MKKFFDRIEDILTTATFAEHGIFTLSQTGDAVPAASSVEPCKA